MRTPPNYQGRLDALSMQRFVAISAQRHGGTRYASVALVPALVFLLVPGWWWAACLMGSILGVVIDIAAIRWSGQLAPRLTQMNAIQTDAALRRHAALIALLTSAYCAPYVLLAWAPMPGPAVGLVFAAGSSIVIATQHVMTRWMVFWTMPACGLALICNMAALAEGWTSIALGALAVMAIINMIVVTRGGAASFRELIEARLQAELGAEELEQRVAERTADLAQATRDAESANRAKSMFLANMSHELRTPLHAVIGYAELMREEISAGEHDACDEYARKIHGSGRHLLGLINDLLDFSRIEAGKIDVAHEDVAIAPLARDAMDLIAPLATKNNNVCIIEIDPDVQVCAADRIRLMQCIVNLLSNAAKFTHGGQIALRVHAEERSGHIRFDVEDTGIGISPEDASRLFQPFVQVDGRTNRSYEGTGLGLAITRRLANLMGGDVTMRSTPGAGSVFSLTVPGQTSLVAA